MILNLKDVASIRTGLVLSRKKSPLSDEHSIAYKQITLKSFSDSTKLRLDDIDDFHAVEEINDSYICSEGDVLVRLREPITAVYIDKESEGMVVPSFVSSIKVNNDLLDKQFLAYYINSNLAQKILERMMRQASIFALKTKDLEDLELTLPPLEEQLKLVKFMKTSQTEVSLLEELKKQKKQFGQAVLDTIITRNRGKE